jgi:hypothetical protein
LCVQQQSERKSVKKNSCKQPIPSCLIPPLEQINYYEKTLMVEFRSQKFSTPPKTGSPSIVDNNNNNAKNDGEKTEQALLSTPDNTETKADEPVETAIQPDQQPIAPVAIKPEPIVVRPAKPLRIVVNGRDILNLDANLRDNSFNLRYTDLPEKNMNLFFANRSQYHRLGANGHVQEYTLVKCNCCDFEYPINGYLTPNNSNIKNNNNNNNNINLSTAINNNFMGNNVANNAKNMINNVANPNANNNNLMQFGNNYNQQQQLNNSNNNSFMNNYQNMNKAASPYWNNNMMNNNNNHNMMNNNNNNARMLSQQFNKNMAPTYGLYKHF